MSETEVFNISIPTDEDGQVLLKCFVCNDLFKVDGSVYGDDDSVFEIHCPSCGIVNPVVRTSFKILDLFVNLSNK